MSSSSAAENVARQLYRTAVDLFSFAEELSGGVGAEEDASPPAFLRALKGAKGGGPALTPAARVVVAAFGVIFGLGFCFIMRNRIFQYASDYLEPPVDVKTVRSNRKVAAETLPPTRRKALDEDDEDVQPRGAGGGAGGVGSNISRKHECEGRGLYAPEVLKHYAMQKKQPLPPSPTKKKKNRVTAV
mmetsp:Transcript_9163/g.22466  ORF Transcript_9163/g.22466 Transcript_9163/m.22466 type:complete len:187 (-) Transcript_9163:468-1028(-)|eukprot:g12087.t1